MEKPIKISLTGKQFAALVMGDVVRIEGENQPDVELLLNDIGFDIMKEYVNDAERERRAGV
jgi:hypothetical protein